MNKFTATIVSWKPFDIALFAGLRALGDLSYPEDDFLRYAFSRPDLAVENIERYSRFCSELKEKTVLC